MTSVGARSLKNIASLLVMKIPGAQMVAINGDSHHHPVETPKQFNKVVLNFISVGKNSGGDSSGTCLSPLDIGVKGKL